MFTTRFNTRCQMVTVMPLLYCTYMMVWSAITSSLNSIISSISLTK